MILLRDLLEICPSFPANAIVVAVVPGDDARTKTPFLGIAKENSAEDAASSVICGSGVSGSLWKCGVIVPLPSGVVG